jgi:hypothetical protein
MGRYLLFVTALTASWLASTGRAAAAEIVSGPQPGKDKDVRIPGTFSPLIINGQWKDGNDKPVDRHHSLVAEFGLRPVVLVFVRSYADEATFTFLKKLDARVAQHKDDLLKGGVVFLCFDDKRSKADVDAKDLLTVAKEKEDILAQLKDKVQGLKSLSAGVFAPDGPAGWKLNKKADVTIVFYERFMVRKSLAFEKGDLDDKTSAAVLAAIDSFIAETKKRRAAERE